MSQIGECQRAAPDFLNRGPSSAGGALVLGVRYYPQVWSPGGQTSRPTIPKKRTTPTLTSERVTSELNPDGLLFGSWPVGSEMGTTSRTTLPLSLSADELERGLEAREDRAGAWRQPIRRPKIRGRDPHSITLVSTTLCVVGGEQLRRFMLIQAGGSQQWGRFRAAECGKTDLHVVVQPLDENRRAGFTAETREGCGGKIGRYPKKRRAEASSQKSGLAVL